jgi:hypothetical protein
MLLLAGTVPRGSDTPKEARVFPTVIDWVMRVSLSNPWGFLSRSYSVS